MPDFGQKQPISAANAHGSSDGPKPHGDRLTGAAQGADKCPGQETGASDNAPGAPDSLKPHGDNLANAVGAAAKER